MMSAKNGFPLAEPDAVSIIGREHRNVPVLQHVAYFCRNTTQTT